VSLAELKRCSADGGSMSELARLPDGHPQAFKGFAVQQINYSEVEPGVIKAFHLHQRQTDIWYVPPSDRMLVVLLDVRQGAKTEGTRLRLTLGAGGSRLLRIPPGVAHGVRTSAASTARLIYFTDAQFSPAPPLSHAARPPPPYPRAPP